MEKERIEWISKCELDGEREREWEKERERERKRKRKKESDEAEKASKGGEKRVFLSFSLFPSTYRRRPGRGVRASARR